MELIEVKARVGKSWLIELLKKAGQEIFVISNGELFQEVDILINDWDSDDLGLLKGIIEMIQKDTENRFDYVCFHMHNSTPEKDVAFLINNVIKEFEHEVDVRTVMILHA